MGGLFQPINQVKFTNVAIVKYKYKGKKFEIACYKNKIIDWRDGAELNLDDVLQSPLIFTNISKGEVAKKTELISCFNSDDNYEICKTILDKGTLQISNRERHTLKEKMYKDIVEILHGMCVNPQTGYPLSTNMIENMIKDVGYSINIDDSAKKQALKVFDILSKNYDNLIQRAFMRIQIICDEFLKSDVVQFLNTHSVIFEENKTTENIKREDNIFYEEGESHEVKGNLQDYNQQEETQTNGDSTKRQMQKEKDTDDEEEEEEEDEEKEKEKEESEQQNVANKIEKGNEKTDISHDIDTATEYINDVSNINEVDEVANTNEEDDLKKECTANENEKSEISLDIDEEKNNSTKEKKQEKNSNSSKSGEKLDTEDSKKKNKKHKKNKKELEKKDIKLNEKYKIVFLCYPCVYRYIDDYAKKNKKYCSCKILNNNVKIATMRQEKGNVEHVPSKNFGHDLEENRKETDSEAKTQKEKGKGKGKQKGKSKLRGRNDSDDEKEQKKREQEEMQNALREEQLKKLAQTEAALRTGTTLTNPAKDANDNIVNHDNNKNTINFVIMCTSCVMKVPKNEYKGHCRSDFHVYNVKRKYKNLQPVTLEEYKEIDFDVSHFCVDT